MTYNEPAGLDRDRLRVGFMEWWASIGPKLGVPVEGAGYVHPQIAWSRIEELARLASAAQDHNHEGGDFRCRSSCPLWESALERVATLADDIDPASAAAQERPADAALITDEQAEEWLRRNDLFAVTHLHVESDCAECRAAQPSPEPAEQEEGGGG